MRGFTAIELIVVMLIMGVLAALAVPRLTDRSALQERGARDQLRSMLAYGRKLAVTQQREVCLLATPAAASVVYANGGACNPALPVTDPAGGGPLRMAMPNGVALGGAAQVRFNVRGQPVPAVNSVLSVGGLLITVQRETGLAS